MINLSRLIVSLLGLLLRGRCILGYSSSVSVGLKFVPLCGQPSVPIENHLRTLRSGIVSNAGSNTVTGLEETVRVIDNSKFAFMNARLSLQRSALIDVRVKGNISNPSNNDDISNFFMANYSNGTDNNNSGTDSSAIMNDDSDFSNDSCDDILRYLGDSVSIMPPQTQDLLRRVTYNYIYGTNEDIITLQEIASIIEEEHRSRDVPVQVFGGDTGRNMTNFLVFEADVTKTGEAFDELCSEILSLGALYQLPKEIILELLSAPIYAPSSRTSTSSVLEYSNSISSSSAIIKCRAAFAAAGWKGVVFPMGLAIRPKTKFRSMRSFQLGRSPFLGKMPVRAQQQQSAMTAASNRKNFIPLSWWHRTKTLQNVAAIAVQNAAAVLPPSRRLIDRRQYLYSLDAQLRQLSTTSLRKPYMGQIVPSSPDLSGSVGMNETPVALSPLVAPAVGVKPLSSTATGQFFFPDTERQWWQTFVSRRSVSNTFRALRRVASQQYSALKRQGRAGLVSYCFFNFLYYSFGVIWQWSRMPILQGDPIPDLSFSLPQLHQPLFTISSLLLRKFGKIFAYLYAFSQLLKVPKLCTAVGLAPLASKCLEMVKKRFGVNETTATAMLITLMVVVWLTLISIPIISEYSSVQHILYLEKQLFHAYGLQPV